MEDYESYEEFPLMNTEEDDWDLVDDNDNRMNMYVEDDE